MLSDTGTVAAFVAAPQRPDPALDDPETVDPSTPGTEATAEKVVADHERVWIRDRVADTTRPVAELASSAPGISGNGCLVAYVVTGASPDSVSPDTVPTDPLTPDATTTVTLTTVDRCTADPSGPLPIGRVVDTVVSADGIVSPPAVSFDGSTIVWSTGDEIRRYVRSDTTLDHEPVDRFDADFDTTPEVRTGRVVDVSADGRAITFVAGPGAVPFAPDVANVYVWSLSDEGPAVIELVSVTVAGTPTTASSGSPTISADGSLVAFESLSADLVTLDAEPAVTPFVVLVDRAASTMRVVADDGRLPQLSADGTRLVHQRGEALRVVSFEPDGTVVEDVLLADVAPDGVTSISRHGRWVALATEVPLVAESADGGLDVWAVDLRPGDDGDLSDTTTTTTTSTTTPSTSTTTPSATSSTVAESTTTAVPSTTVESVDGPETVPPSTTVVRPVVFPRVSAPIRVFTPRTTSRRSTGSSSLDGTGAFLDAAATPIRFEATIVGAGRRTATSTFVAGRATTVRSVDVVDGPFSVVVDSCSGRSLRAGESCTVEVDFRPDTVGPATGFLTFGLGDGSVVSAQLDGDGSPEPTLDAVPGVAMPGQVVTVFGAGFPGGAIVDLQRGTELVQVSVEANGTFAHVFVVMPHTPAGPMDLVVVGQVDRFADVSGELLVSARNAGTGSAAFRDSIVTGLGR